MTQPDINSLAARLLRARAYPYEIPTQSFVYRHSGTMAFDASLTAGRTPVLAIGSNQAPERLAQKFGHDASHEIPVQRAELDDFDVVYSAHISSYGAVPAMLQACPGASVAVAVTWLDDVQLEMMHETEIAAANYHFAELEDVQVRLDDARMEPRALAYVSSRGHLNHNGQPLALATIACKGRRFPTATTDVALERVRHRVAPGMTADDFVHRLIDDTPYRRSVIESISADSDAFAHPFQVLR